MKILLSGIKGFMGKEVVKLCNAGVRDGVIAAGVDINADGTEGVPCVKTFAEAPADVDCIIDFSHFSLTEDLLKFAVKNHLPLVLLPPEVLQQVLLLRRS